MKINEVWAYVSEDEKGNEGICGWLDQKTNQWLPMMAADEKRLESLRVLAIMIAKQTNKKIKIAKFSMREDVEEIIWKG